MKIGYKIQDKFDLGMFLSMIALSIFGLIAIYSATSNNSFASGNFDKQAVWFLISIIVFFAIYFLPSGVFKNSSIWIYLLALLFLFLVLFVGKTVSGAKSWFSLGPIGFQPSEFGKVGLIFILAYWLSDKNNEPDSFKSVFVAVLLSFFPIVFVLLEPDMGTAIVYVLITLIMIFWSGVDLFSLFVVLSPAIVMFGALFGSYSFAGALFLIVLLLLFFKKNLFISASVFVLNISSGFFIDFIYNLLKPHQQKRIDAFINPDSDPLGHGYNALQAKVAIGSGGFFGKGFLEGNQTQLRFIPEQWTDFIYCVISEEFGFLGSATIIIFFIVLFSRLLNISLIVKDNFSSLVIIGIFALIFSHFLINIGMNIGVTPVVGIPLTFLSYGGSSLLVNIALLGVVANMYKNRKERT